MDEAATDGSFTVAQTNGMERRGDRRDTPQDCRQENGAVSADKRNCKQEGRQQGRQERANSHGTAVRAV